MLQIWLDWTWPHLCRGNSKQGFLSNTIQEWNKCQGFKLLAPTENPSQLYCPLLTGRKNWVSRVIKTAQHSFGRQCSRHGNLVSPVYHQCSGESMGSCPAELCGDATTAGRPSRNVGQKWWLEPWMVDALLWDLYILYILLPYLLGIVTTNRIRKPFSSN